MNPRCAHYNLLCNNQARLTSSLQLGKEAGYRQERMNSPVWGSCAPGIGLLGYEPECGPTFR